MHIERVQVNIRHDCMQRISENDCTVHGDDADQGIGSSVFHVTL